MVDINIYRLRVGTFLPQNKFGRPNKSSLIESKHGIIFSLTLLCLLIAIFSYTVPNGLTNKEFIHHVYYLKCVKNSSMLVIFNTPLLTPPSNNFYARYTYGNKKQGIKLVHWNKGSSFLENKMDDKKTKMTPKLSQI